MVPIWASALVGTKGGVARGACLPMTHSPRMSVSGRAYAARLVFGRAPPDWWMWNMWPVSPLGTSEAGRTAL